MRRLIFALALVAARLAAPAAEPLAPVPSEVTPRARVVVAEDRTAMSAFNPVPERVEELFNRGLQAFTEQGSREAAWRSLVSTQDTIGIKVVSFPGAQGGTRPPIVAAMVKGLLAAGVPAPQIIIWDKSLGLLRRAGYADLAERLGVRIAGCQEEGYDEDQAHEIPLLGRLVWGDHEFGRPGEGTGRKSFASKLVTRRFTKIINVAPLLNHNLAGVSGCLYTLAMDSFDNTIRFEVSPEHLAQAVPEFYAHEAVGDKVVLHIVDGLLCQYLGEDRALLHYSTVLGQLRFSTDPLALDLLSMREIQRQREIAGAPAAQPIRKIYSNAALLELGVADLKSVDTVTVR